MGSYVWSENVYSGESGYKRVVKTFVSSTNTLVRVKVGAEEIVTTKKHPFWVEGEGWKEAGEILQGDLVKNNHGEIFSVQNIEYIYLENAVEVYNFEVQDWHTYFVGIDSILVHNQCAKEFVKASRTSKEVIKYLKKNGFRIVKQEGSHVKLTDDLVTVIVPQHSKDLGKGLLHAIMKEAGLL